MFELENMLISRLLQSCNFKLASLSFIIPRLVPWPHLMVVHIILAAGVAARPGKVVGSVLRYNNCGAVAAAEALEQRRMVRNPAGTTQYTAANSYPRRNPSCKNERVDNDGVESSNGLQPKPQYMARKVAAAQGGSGGHWF